MPLLWDLIKLPFSMAGGRGREGVNDSGADANLEYKDVKIGCSITYTDDEFNDFIVGKVKDKGATVVGEPFAVVQFERPLHRVHSGESKFRYLQRFAKRPGRACTIFRIPISSLRTHDCFIVLDQEGEVEQAAEGQEQHIAHGAGDNDTGGPDTKCQDTTHDSCNNNARHGSPVARSSSEQNLPSTSTQDHHHVALVAQAGLTPSQRLLALVKSRRNSGSPGAEKSFCETPRKLDLDTGPEFIVPPIALKEFHETKDSTLVALFGFTSIFDGLLIEQPLDLESCTEGSDTVRTAGNSGQSPTSSPCSKQIRNLISKYIVNELRQVSYYCSADPIMLLRKMLSPLNSKITSQFMDPEELILLLFEQVLHLKEFITYDNGVADFLHQLHLEAGTKIKPFITTRRLLELSMKSNGLKFKHIPSPALILEMPRSNGNLLNGLKGIIPNLSLDITSLVVDAPRPCISCGEPAKMECDACFDLFRDAPSGSDSTAFCIVCYITLHKHPGRREHPRPPTQISRAVGTRIRLDLIAVICIRGFHFVSFVRSDPKSAEAPWIFFDSNPTGKNPIHEILPDMGKWLSNLEMGAQNEIIRSWSQESPMLRRIVEDGHICIYSHRQEED